MTNESLFTSQTPGLPNVNEGVPVTVAGTFRFAAPGVVKGFRMYAPATVGSGTYAGALWNITQDDSPILSGVGTLIDSATFGALSAGWNEVLLGTPAVVDDTSTYRVGLRTSEGRYAATSGLWASAGITNGNITGIQDGSSAPGLAVLVNGSFTSGLTNYPNNTFGSNGYFIDVIYEADSGELHTAAGTGIVGIAGTVEVRSVHTAAGTGAFGISASGTHSGGDGGGPQEGAAYELEQVMDALAAVFNGVETGDEIGGVAVTMECHPEVTAQVQPPSMVLEIDDLNWDLNMGSGADSWTVTALALVTYQDMDSAQRLLWRFLSRKRTSGIMRIKAALEANQTLGGLVSYAVLASVRNIGTINYAGVDYLGAELIIEVMS